MKIDVRYCDDWEALYIDGELYDDRDTLNWHNILGQLASRLGIGFSSEAVKLPEDFSEETHYIEFTPKLEDIEVGRYDEHE